MGTIDLAKELDRGSHILIEVPQGFGLGINSGLEYPYVTSREISISQALSDAQLHPSYLGCTLMSVRTYPIRVGHLYDKNNEMIGNSGPFFPDSKEKSWSELGLQNEYTTTTKRIRRVATFSIIQYQQALRAIKPDYVFLNFVNYFKTFRDFDSLRSVMASMGKAPEYFGIGPTTDDVYTFARMDLAVKQLGWL